MGTSHPRPFPPPHLPCVLYHLLFSSTSAFLQISYGCGSRYSFTYNVSINGSSSFNLTFDLAKGYVTTKRNPSSTPGGQCTNTTAQTHLHAASLKCFSWLNSTKETLLENSWQGTRRPILFRRQPKTLHITHYLFLVFPQTFLTTPPSERSTVVLTCSVTKIPDPVCASPLSDALSDPFRVALTQPSSTTRYDCHITIQADTRTVSAAVGTSAGILLLLAIGALVVYRRRCRQLYLALKATPTL